MLPAARAVLGVLERRSVSHQLVGEGQLVGRLGPDQPVTVHGGVVVRHRAPAQAGGRQDRLVDRFILLHRTV